MYIYKWCYNNILVYNMLFYLQYVFQALEIVVAFITFEILLKNKNSIITYVVSILKASQGTLRTLIYPSKLSALFPFKEKVVNLTISINQFFNLHLLFYI